MSDCISNSDLKLRECIVKLEAAPSSDVRAKMIWGWIKQDHINLRQFKVLVGYCSD